MIMVSEHNKNMHAIEYQRKPATLVKQWWQQTILRWSQLISTSTANFEPGGTMIITHTRSTAHTCSAGDDKYHLGRWNYITLRGKQEQYTTIISVYRPTQQQETFLRQTAYTAKRMHENNRTISTAEIWFLDLEELIIEKRQIRKAYDTRKAKLNTTVFT
jgi:hypothetical protein